MEDWELLSRWRSGDRGAGNQLLGRYLDLLSRFFRNKVSNDADVADLVSESLLACSQGRDSIRKVRSFRSYLFGVAYRTLRHYYRKRSKRAREEDDFLLCCVDDLGAQPSASRLLGRQEEATLLLRALRTIRLEYQIVLEMNFFEGLSGREIGESLEVPTATVHTRLRRGKEHLAAAVKRLAATPELSQSTMSGLQTWARDVREILGRSG